MGVSGDADKAIFISYCHADNDDTLGEGWIEQFHKVLRSRLKAITGVRNPDEELGIWRDREIQGNEEFSPVLLEKINQAKINYKSHLTVADSSAPQSSAKKARMAFGPAEGVPAYSSSYCHCRL